MLARLAVQTSWANTSDREARMKPVQEGRKRRFEKLVDPDGVLPPEERAQRAQAAERAHMAKMALRSSQARAKKRESA
jgi:hypothetical protein